MAQNLISSDPSVAGIAIGDGIESVSSVPCQSSLFGDLNLIQSPPPPPPTPPPSGPIDRIEYHEIAVLKIYEHPEVRSALQAMEIVSLWSFPGKYFSRDGIREILSGSPLHAIEVKGAYLCFRGFLSLEPAKRAFPLTACIPLLVHTCVAPDEIYRAAYAELVLEPLWHHLDSDECKRLTDLVVRLRDNPRVGSLSLAETKCALAMLVKRSLSALRQKKAQNV